MNCKPGDLAVVVGRSDYAGMLVDIICIAPIGVKFDLPNGTHHKAINESDVWIIKSIGSKFKCPLDMGFFTSNQYATGSDRWLRPIRPGDLHETTDEHNEVTA